MRRTDRELPQPPARDRPNRPWLCGQLGSEHACDIGPNAHGQCPLRHVCKPTRTWHAKRRPWLAASFAVALVLVVIVLAYPVNPIWIKPGELSTPHAQILSTAMESQRCETCHPSVSVSSLSWFFSAGDAHDGIDQTERCLKCHHSLAPSSLARSAHNVPEATRNLIRLASSAIPPAKAAFSPATPHGKQDDLACGVCHQEHHGPDANLKLVSDARCQTCHSTTFDRFSTNHPGWDSWPYGNGGEIGFDHSKHLNKHFPASTVGGSAVEFRCDACHSQNTQNEITRTESYESACAACHDESLKIASGEGIELVSLPMLPAELANQEKGWPSRATGFLDGGLSPLAELLLRSDPSVASAIEAFPARDFSQADVSSSVHRGAATGIAKGTKSLLVDIASNGQTAIARRAQDAGIHSVTLDEFLRSLPPQLVSDTLGLWFSDPKASDTFGGFDSQEVIGSPSDQLRNTSDSLLSVDALLDGDSLDGDLLSGEDDLLGGGSDLLSNDVLSNSSDLHVEKKRMPDGRFDASLMMPAGGWYRDDVRMAIRYRGVSHADATLRATIEMVSQVPTGDPVRDRILALTAIQSCVECHPSSVSSQPTWVSKPRVGRTDLFTKFSHGPHLNIAALADCKQCHTIASGEPASERSGNSVPMAKRGGAKNGRLEVLAVSHSIASGTPLLTKSVESSIEPHRDFERLDKESCVGCHTPHASNDSCTTCHRYHIR